MHIPLMDGIFKSTRALLMKLAFLITAILFSFPPCHLQYSYYYSMTDGSRYSQNISQQFCHINNFSGSKEVYDMLLATPLDCVNSSFVAHNVQYGRPFVVSGVTQSWKANDRWDGMYFKRVFSGFELFSSTFATNVSPVFDSSSDDKDIYYGIFLNDRAVAEVIAEDFQYPSFIPHHLRIQGNEWVHWGYPPCGAKRHMDLMATSRISVQVKGVKHWRLYPLLTEELLADLMLSNWTGVLHPMEVVVGPGDAVVWFPGWEHETRILEGLSISLSLHFETTLSSLYVRTFLKYLIEKVSPLFEEIN